MDTGDYHQQTFVTGGNDGFVNLWRVPRAAANKKRKKKREAVVNQVCTEEETDLIVQGSVNLNSKINFVSSYHTETVTNTCHILIGDQTPSVKVYGVTNK